MNESTDFKKNFNSQEIKKIHFDLFSFFFSSSILDFLFPFFNSSKSANRSKSGSTSGRSVSKIGGEPSRGKIGGGRQAGSQAGSSRDAAARIDSRSEAGSSRARGHGRHQDRNRLRHELGNIDVLGNRDRGSLQSDRRLRRADGHCRGSLVGWMSRLNRYFPQHRRQRLPRVVGDRWIPLDEHCWRLLNDGATVDSC